jgi:hypothetical protein
LKIKNPNYNFDVGDPTNNIDDIDNINKVQQNNVEDKTLKNIYNRCIIKIPSISKSDSSFEENSSLDETCTKINNVISDKCIIRLPNNLDIQSKKTSSYIQCTGNDISVDVTTDKSDDYVDIDQMKRKKNKNNNSANESNERSDISDMSEIIF